MGKFYYIIIMIGLLMASLALPVQQTEASNEKMYVSNRIKIVRPGTVVGEVPATAPTVQAGGAALSTGAPSSEQPEGGPVAGVSADQSGVSVPAASVSPVSNKTQEQAATAVPSSSEAAIKTEFASLLGTKEKFYTRKGRIDPFEPFLRKPEPEVPVDKQAELTRRVPRTPLEKIELSQLRLTGILRAENKTRALVQEASGKGYIVDEGTYIGNKGGQVAKILKDRITVSEKALDVFGKINVVERELKLQP